MSVSPTQRSLTECWVPPQLIDNEGRIINQQPVGFISTTFTFDAEFFEEECLTRFLVMETEKENDGAAFLVEKEEKLAGLSTALVLADQHHCRGSRSLRWQLAPCRLQRGIMHAKVTILQWSDCIRLIIGSANLTKPGYCINQEVYSCIDYYRETESDPLLLTATLDFLQDLAEGCCSPTIIATYSKFNNEIRACIKTWEIAHAVYRKDDVTMVPLFISPHNKRGLERLRKTWDNSFNSPPDQAFIVSPFYDQTVTEFTPSRKLAEVMQQRGSVDINYLLTTETTEEENGIIYLHAPSFLAEKTKDNQGIRFLNVNEEGKNEKEALVQRPMHLKQLWLQKADFSLLMLGSSNFTSAALGTGNRVNYEANLVYVFDQSRNKKAKRWMTEIYPAATMLDNRLIQFKASLNEDDIINEPELPNLPLFFSEAILRKESTGHFLELSFAPDKATPPSGFEVWHIPEKNNEGKMRIFSLAEWEQLEKNSVLVPWKEESLPDSLMVSWAGASAMAFWPVLVESQTTLPPVDILRNLSLEALLQILSSSQPLHRLLKLIERLKREKSTDSTEKVLDALQLVDTSRFLLQRTRRVSYAMKALRERLEKPVYTLESLNWRLYGPIGVASLKEAIKREAKTAEERFFLFAELALELARVSPHQMGVSIDPVLIKEEIRKVLQQIREEFANEQKTGAIAIIEYSERALNKAIHEV